MQQLILLKLVSFVVLNLVVSRLVFLGWVPLGCMVCVGWRLFGRDLLVLKEKKSPRTLGVQQKFSVNLHGSKEKKAFFEG